MLKKLLVDGEEHFVVLERCSSDGGLVVSYLSPAKDGSHLAKRDWYQDPSLAQQVFDTADDVKAREKKAEIVDMLGVAKV